MNKKYPAQRITVFAVYRKFCFRGEFGRVFTVALPDLQAAEKWIEDKINADRIYRKDDFMIEEFSGWMKAWQPFKF